MENKNKSSKDIKYSIWNTRTDEKISFIGNKQKEAIDFPDSKENK